MHGVLLKRGALKTQKSGKLVTKDNMKCVDDHIQGISEFGFTIEFVRGHGRQYKVIKQKECKQKQIIDFRSVSLWKREYQKANIVSKSTADFSKSTFQTKCAAKEEKASLTTNECTVIIEKAI